ncbi:hypothetical protein SBRY_60132 [Actinacidiphila bryophytorum]|uniref:Uncharacterized protein n=1 Tax=Actinacidiphila bryophytorum TaxID=1436133 RepID=A0A9W4H617_9ACTN|nr:hypothetical protein SBRY_60132 [Actinacidiphila bryophytorum]
MVRTPTSGALSAPKPPSPPPFPRPRGHLFGGAEPPGGTARPAPTGGAGRHRPEGAVSVGDGPPAGGELGAQFPAPLKTLAARRKDTPSHRGRREARHLRKGTRKPPQPGDARPLREGGG